MTHTPISPFAPSRALIQSLLALCLVTPLTAEISSDNLLSYFPMNGDTSNVFDSPVGAATWTGSPTYNASGLFGKSAVIGDGAGSNFLTTIASEYDFGEGSFTVLYWVNVNSNVDSDPALVAGGGKNWSSSGGSQGWVSTISGDDIKSNISDGSTRFDTSSIDLDTGADRWALVALVVDRSAKTLTTFNLDFNVTTIGDDSSAPTVVALANGLGDITGGNQSIIIGQDGDLAGYDRAALPPLSNIGIDDLSIWGRALSQAEIQEIYTTGRAGNDLSTLVFHPASATFNQAIATSTVTWDAYDTSGLSAPEIKISRDGVVIATLSGGSDTTYTDTTIPTSRVESITHDYQVQLFDGATSVTGTKALTSITWTQVIKKDLLGYYPMDGSLTDDSSTVGGSASNNAATWQSGSATYDPGLFGQSSTVGDGAGSNFIVASGSEYNFGEKDFTLLYWVNQKSAVSSDPVLFASGGKNWSSSGNSLGWVSTINSSSIKSNVGGPFRADTSWVGLDSSDNTKWSLVALVADRSNSLMTTYVLDTNVTTIGDHDSTPTAVALGAGSITSNNDIVIGQDGDGAGYGTGGYPGLPATGIDDVSVWGRALSIDELQIIYTTGRSGGALTSSLGGYYVIADLDKAANEVNLSWDAYYTTGLSSPQVKVFRNNTVIATLAAGVTSYTDAIAAPDHSVLKNNYRIELFDGANAVASTSVEDSVEWIADNILFNDSLIANYRFEDGFKDTAGAPVVHDAVAFNGTEISANGKFGQGVTFLDQLKQGVRIDDASAFNSTGSADFTLSLWMQRNGAVADTPNGEIAKGAILTKQDASDSANPGWGLYGTSDGGVQFSYTGDYEKSVTIAAGSEIATLEWFHVLVSCARDGAAKCYINGSFRGSIDISTLGSSDNAMPLSMGVDGSGTVSWKGKLDEVAIWRRTLTPSEITEVYTTNLSGQSLSGSSIVDSDDDKMDDAWELTHFGNTAQEATGDYDGDGISNFQEYAQGSNPNSANSIQANRVTIEEVAGQDYPILHYIRPTLTSNVKYIAESTQDLTNWSSLNSNFIPFGNPTDKGNGDSEHHLRYYQTLSAVTAGRTMMRVRMESQYQGAISETINPIVELRDGKAYITWTTSTPTVSIVDYSLDGQNLSRYEDYTLSTSHSVEIADFQPGESFSYTVVQVTSGVETKSNTFSIEGKWDYSPPAIVDQGGFDSGSDWSTRAAEILALPEVLDRGYALDAQCGDGRLAYELARQSQLVVIGVEDTQAEVDAARAFLEARGVYGSRVTVVLASDLANLPFPADFFNLVVSQNQVSTTSDYAAFATAMDTVAIPNRGVIAGYDGSSMLSNKKAVRAGTGSWTMSFGNPANTSASAEEFSGKNKMTDFELRWLGAPGSELAWDRQTAESPPLVANGRFYCQGKGRILSLDSHNGSVLWSKELDDAQRFNMLHSAGNLTADEDAVWLAFNKECWKMAGDTGALTTFNLIEGSNSNINYEWSYICRTGNHLLGSATASAAAYDGHWGGGFWYTDSGSHVSKVVSDNLFSLDKDSGATNWEYTDGLIVDVTITVGNNKVYLLETRNAAAVAGDSRKLGLSTWRDSLYLVCLDLATGSKLWDVPHTLTGGQRNTFLMYDEVNDRLVINTGDGSSNHLYAFNATTGAATWNATAANYKNDHGGKNQKAVITNGKVYLTPNIYDIANGSVSSTKIPTNNGLGCNTYWGSKNMLFFRTGYSNEGLSMWPVDDSEVYDGLENVRGACWLNWAPADGMFLIQEKSSGCSCGQWIHVSLGWGPKSN